MTNKKSPVAGTVQKEVNWKDESEKLFDSRFWDPSAVFNYNYIYVYNLKQVGDYMGYKEGHIKPGFQIYYKDAITDTKLKALDFDEVYIYAIYEPIYRYYDDVREGAIYFKSKTTEDMYEIDNSFSCVDLYERANDYCALKNSVTASQLQQKENVCFYTTRGVKISNLLF